MMKTGRLFWGTFFLATGMLLLLEQMGVFSLGMLSVWRYWPALLILWGLAALTSNRGLRLGVLVVAALLLAILAYGFLSFSWLRHDNADRDAEFVETFVEPYDERIREATFSLDAAAGRFTIEGTTSDLISATMVSDFGRYVLDRDSLSEHERLTLRMEGHVPRWGFGRGANRATISLNPNPVWDMSFDVGAASVDFDFSQYKVERVRVDAGAASIRMKFGSLADETHVNMDSGVSSVRLSIPSEAGCEMNLDTGLSRKRLEGFERINSGKYRTENFGSASKRIYVDLTAGLSSIRVDRY